MTTEPTSRPPAGPRPKCIWPECTNQPRLPNKDWSSFCAEHEAGTAEELADAREAMLAKATMAPLMPPKPSKRQEPA